MLIKNKIQVLKYQDYKDFIDENLDKKIKKLAGKLAGLNVVNINATPTGGGVAEILNSLVPLMNSLELDASWYSLKANKDFFTITKKIHFYLQNGKGSLSQKEKNTYLEYNKNLAIYLKKIKADIWVIHDPQPMPIAFLNPKIYPAIWHCHIDASHPSKSVWKFLKPFIKGYDKLIFTAREYAHSLPEEMLKIFPPAIDPLSEKNKYMDLAEAKRIIKDYGLHIEKPIVTQISRFDLHKDPIGAIQAYKIAKKKIPDLQLALLGIASAKDDPEADEIFHQVCKYASNDKNIHCFNKLKNKPISNDKLINAFQTGSDVILQKSIKEGFGLTVAEAMFKEKTVIGGNAFGIKMQIQDEKNGFIANNYKECGQKIVEVLQHPEIKEKIEKAAKKSARKNFLMPRLLYDYLKLFEEIKNVQNK